MTEQKKVLFVCIENSCRSQMAKGFFNAMTDEAIADSAGTIPADHVDETAIQVMKEVGIDISNEKPKEITPEMNETFHYIVTMGCIEECPLTPQDKTIEWDIQDPKGSPLEDYYRIRDTIKDEVAQLIRKIL